MTDEVEVYVQLEGKDTLVGSLHRQPRRGFEAVGFRYDPAWLSNANAFSLQPSLPLDTGPFVPVQGQALLGALSDSAPDTWGRSLMRRAERHQAKREERPVRTLQELDFLLGVSDTARLGALRFKRPTDEFFLAPDDVGVPSIVHVGRLFEATTRTLLDEESAEDVRLILAPGSSLGGARPKASLIDSQGNLAMAKFPKPNDEYSLERWEAIAHRLAAQAGIVVARTELREVGRVPFLLSHRFDRTAGLRVPFLSALAMLDLRDGQASSYPEMVDAISMYGANARADSEELFRRMVFNILASNVDDHMRNHAFLWSGTAGWVLAPAYDLNPTPTDVRPRVLTTAILDEDHDCDIELALAAAEYFGLSLRKAEAITTAVAQVTKGWREVASDLGSSKNEIERMSSAFEHPDLHRSLRM